MDTKEYYKLNRKKLLEYSKNYYIRNKSRVLSKQKARLKKLTKDKNSKYYLRHNLTPRIKKVNCQICGSKKNLNRHHWNYDKPKIISVLCDYCHRVQHYKPQLNGGELLLLISCIIF